MTFTNPNKAGIAPGVIWVTGFSGAGKSTVATELWQVLVQAGAKAILLDGDELRDIYGAPYGYSRKDRVALGYVNFTMCRYLAAQGCTVVIAAAGMYDEVLAWSRAHTPNFYQVYLRVPDAERRRRDAATKQVYAELTGLTTLYDEPAAPDLVIDNLQGVTPADAARAIAEFYIDRHPPRSAGHPGSFWDGYHAEGARFAPSDFAHWTLERGGETGRLLEIGCGRGADAALYADAGWQVIAIDSSAAAITACRNATPAAIDFQVARIQDAAGEFAGSIDLAVCRGLLDAVPRIEEPGLLKAARQVLRPDGRLAVECASIADPMHRRGKAIGPGERLQERYRRFHGRSELAHQLERAGFAVEFVEEVVVPRADEGEPAQVLLRVIARAA